MLPNADPVHKISIVSRGMSLGHTRQLPLEDRHLYSRGQLRDMVATLLGGRTAENLIFNEMTSGASDDIKRATELARKMVTDLGMSDTLGPRTFGDKQEMVFLGREISEQRDYSEKVALDIDKEVQKIIENAYDAAKKILHDNKARLILIGKKLVVEETLEGAALEAAFTEPVPVEEKPEAAEQPAGSPTTAS